MQMHRKHLAQDPIQPPILPHIHPHRPFRVFSVRCEGVWQSVVESAGSAVVEAEGEDFEGGNVFGEEGSPELEVEEGAPVCRAWTGRFWGVRDYVEGFAEVGGVLAESEEGAVKWRIRFICRVFGKIYTLFFVKGSVP